VVFLKFKRFLFFIIAVTDLFGQLLGLGLLGWWCLSMSGVAASVAF